jgi:hypothetical protein
MRYDPKWASDSTGLSGGFSGQGYGLKIGARQLTFSELVLSCPAAGTSAQYLFVGGSLIKFVLSINKIVLFGHSKTIDI